jgi:hypothetical protein
VTDRPDRETPETPATGPARDVETHPAADAAALRKLGSQPVEPDKINISGHDATGTTDRASVAGAAQDAYWRQRYADRAYADPARGYEHYRPAYQYGWESRDRYSGRSFGDVERQLREGWDPDRTGLAWEEAEPAIRDAFEARPNTELSDPGNPLA